MILLYYGKAIIHSSVPPPLNTRFLSLSFFSMSGLSTSMAKISTSMAKIFFLSLGLRLENYWSTQNKKAVFFKKKEVGIGRLPEMLRIAS